MKPLVPLVLFPVIVLASAPLVAAEHGTIVREAIIYLSPDTSSSKLGQAERGREVILLDKSSNYLHVEAMLGNANVPDPAFVEDEEAVREPSRIMESVK